MTHGTMAAWLAWACPAQPSTMLAEPALARLRERWPLGAYPDGPGGGEGPDDYEALRRTMAAPREEQERPAVGGAEPVRGALVELFPDAIDADERGPDGGP